MCLMRSPRLAIVAAIATSLLACGVDASPHVDADPEPARGAPLPTPPSEPPSSSPPPALVPPSSPDALPAITSGEGITVERVERVSARTFDVLLSTPNVDPAATVKGNGVRVTLPPGYATSGKRYPVVYHLHGAGGNSYTVNWAKGKLEAIASGPNADVIIVMPDAGKGGWYTDWIDQSVAQKWKTYHLSQLVPFVDRNLRTIGDRSGRGVMGISMGGFGAIRYATDRPDLFAAVASISGAIDLETVGVQTAVIAPSILFGLPAFGAFGPYGNLGSKWIEVNPVRRAGQLGAVSTFLYVGGGGADPAGFIAEGVVREATVNHHEALAKAGVQHHFENIGTPGKTPFGDCPGDHSYACMMFEVSKALPKVVEVLAAPR